MLAMDTATAQAVLECLPPLDDGRAAAETRAFIGALAGEKRRA